MHWYFYDRTEQSKLWWMPIFAWELSGMFLLYYIFFNGGHPMLESIIAFIVWMFVAALFVIRFLYKKK